MDDSGFHSPDFQKACTGCVIYGGSLNSNKQHSCEQHKEAKFSTLLTVPCIAVTVGSDEAKTFHLHELLLCHESERFLKQLSGSFKESTTRSIGNCEEDPELFGYFVEYLYRDGWACSPGIKHNSEYVTLARLYAMGERLGAEKFQQAVLRKFSNQFPCMGEIPDQGICDLLTIVCSELPERLPEDPLRALVFWYASTRLVTLKAYVEFKSLLIDLPDLARYLCLRAGNTTTPQPRNKSSEHITRFKAEADV